jgi:hypothetical protein
MRGGCCARHSDCARLRRERPIVRVAVAQRHLDLGGQREWSELHGPERQQEA